MVTPEKSRKDTAEEQTTQEGEIINPERSSSTPIAISKESVKGSKRGSKRCSTKTKKLVSKKKKKSKKPSLPKSKKPSVETEEMPPTANSENSSKKNQNQKNTKKKKSASAEKAKEPIPAKEPASKQKTLPPSSTAIKPSVATSTTTVEDVKPEKKKKKKPLKRETNHVFHLRPGVNKAVEHLRRRNFEEELMMFETGQFTYLTDPTRYRFRSVPQLELVIQYVFPSLLILALMLSTMTITRFLTDDHTKMVVFKEMNELTLIQYDAYMIVDSIDNYLQNTTVLLEMNCPGLIQGPYKPLLKNEMHFFNYKAKVVRKAVKAISYRWMYPIDAVMNMNYGCPPSILIELEK